MITRITSSLPSFKQVELKPGFNVILADRTKEATKKDTRNGLGKSLLIDIIHFCLGARFSTSTSRLAHPDLDKTTFEIELTVGGRTVRARRNTGSPLLITLTGDIQGIPGVDNTRNNSLSLSVSEWTSFLGQHWFGVLTDSPRKYSPSFRSIISYFIRSGKDAYSDPFRHFRMQATWDIQVNNAFLLGLRWEDASDWQVIRDQKKTLDALKQAAEEGLLDNVWGARGRLEADRVRLMETVERTSKDLKAFKVHSQYRELEVRANSLTALISRLSNENVLDSRVLEMYKESVQDESAASSVNLAELYESARVVFPEAVSVRLDEVEKFHSHVIENRKGFLRAEIDRINGQIESRKASIGAYYAEHEEVLRILNTHGALDQYTELQQAHWRDVMTLSSIEDRLENMRRFEEGKSTVKVNVAMLEQRARANYDERSTSRERCVALFNSNSESLYNAPGAS